MDGIKILTHDTPCVNDLPHTYQATLEIISNLCDNPRGYCFAKNKALAQMRKSDIATVKRHIAYLVAGGYVTIQHVGRDRRLFVSPAVALEVRHLCATYAPRINTTKRETEILNTYVIPNENSEETQHTDAVGISSGYAEETPENRHDTPTLPSVTDAEEANLRGVLTPVGAAPEVEGDSRLEEDGAVCAVSVPHLAESAGDVRKAIRGHTSNSIPHPPADKEATQAQTTLIEIERSNEHDGRAEGLHQHRNKLLEQHCEPSGDNEEAAGRNRRRGKAPGSSPKSTVCHNRTRQPDRNETLDTLIEIERSNEHDGIRESARTRAGDAGHHVRTQGIRTDVNRRQGVIPRAADRASDIPPRQPVCQKGNLRGAIEAGVSGVESGALETLIEIGVSPSEAVRLTAQFEAAHIARCVAAYLQERARGKARGVGWLCTAICRGWNVKLLDMSPETIQKRGERLRVREVATVEYGGVKPDMAYLRSRLGGIGV